MKRVIAVSDSHGCPALLEEVIDTALSEGPVDTVVFLGDGCEDFEKLTLKLYFKHIRVLSVAGNNDWGSSLQKEIEFSVEGVRFFACHGHTQYVKYGLDRLWYSAREKSARVVLYGHTHFAKAETIDGIDFINPGAVCRAGSGEPCYAELCVYENGAVMPRLGVLHKV